jgi:hypothetical protein
MTQPQSGNNKDNPVIDGDPFGPIKTEQNRRGLGPREINEAHNNSDKDTSANAQHHTLGPGRNQASPGSHVHDGNASKKIGSGLSLVATNGAAPSDAVRIQNLFAMLHKVIEFTE